MKYQTPDSMKFKKLQRRLKLSKAATIGILELLWIMTEEQASRGDIGWGMSNQRIADCVDWEGDADELINALVDTGWLHRCPLNRLQINDWDDRTPYWLVRPTEN